MVYSCDRCIPPDNHLGGSALLATFVIHGYVLQLGCGLGDILSYNLQCRCKPVIFSHAK